MKHLLPAAVALLCVALLAGRPARAAWKTDEPLAFGGTPLRGAAANVRLAWNPAAGRLGLAYVETGTGALVQVEWQPGAGVVRRETVAAAATAALGLAYDANGIPRVGALNGAEVSEYVRQPDGTWERHLAGSTADPAFTCGAYAFNAAAGAGGFLVNTRTDPVAKAPQATYLHFRDGQWRAVDCGVGGRATNALVFSKGGAPFGLWGKWRSDVDFYAMIKTGGELSPMAMNFTSLTAEQYGYEQTTQGRLALDPATDNIWAALVVSDWPGMLVARRWAGDKWGAPDIIDYGSGMSGDEHAQLGFAISPANDRAAMYPTNAGGAGGIGMAYRDHAKNAWALEVLPMRGDPAGLDLLYDPAGNLYGLYCGAADGQFHLLSGYVPPAPLYARVTVHDQPEPCVIHLFGHNTRNGSFTSHANIWEDGLHAEETVTRYPENVPAMLQGNEASPWVDLTPVRLAPYGDTTLECFAMQETITGGMAKYDPGLKAASFSVSISTTPSEEGLVATFTRSGPGSGMMLVIDPSKPGEIKDDLAWSRWQNAIARALPPTPGRAPTKFPITAACEIRSQFYRRETCATEMDTFTRLGLNDIDRYDPEWYARGFTRFSWGSNYRYPPYLVDNDRTNIDAPLIVDYVKKELENARKTGHVDDLTYWSFYDEPSGPLADHVIACAVCREKFRAYLQRLGYTPQALGYASWEQVRPSMDREKEPVLYYHTGMFRCQAVVDLFKVGTDTLVQSVPNIPTTANFSDEYTASGSMLYSGIDQFAMFEQGALRLGWTETWLPYVATKQLAGCLADFMRGAVNGQGTGKFGMYNIHDVPWDFSAKQITEVGHGAQQIYNYNWGPYYAMAVDTCSNDPAWYRALQVPNNAIGAVEDYLVGGTVPRSQVAILYSQATDIWSVNFLSGQGFGYSLYGLDNVGQWLLLRHLGYPVDFVDEKQVAAGRLTRDRYKVVLCNAAYLLEGALPPLLAWVKAGGQLILGPNALTHTQYGAPLGFDARAGIRRQPFVQAETAVPVNPGLAGMKNLLPVRFGAETLEAVGGCQQLAAPRGTTVLATFPDGAPALFTMPLGKGRLAVSGFFTGLSYEKPAIAALLAREKANPDFPTRGATEWPAAHRALFSALLKPAKLALPVATSHYLLEASRLEGPAAHPGTVIALTNWTGAPLGRVTVTLPRNGNLGQPSTVIHPIVAQATKHGMLTVTLDMQGPVDFLVVPRQ